MPGKQNLSKDQMSVDDLFGTVTCEECHTVWGKEFVPEFCTKCGIRVSETRGKGVEDIVRLVERVYPPVKLATCPRCGERYFKNSCPPKCLRCWNDLRPARQANWLIRVFRRLLHI